MHRFSKFSDYYKSKNIVLFCQVFAGLLLTGFLSGGAELMLLKAANAAPRSTQPATETAQNQRANRLPPAIANAVRRDLSRLVNVRMNQLQVVSAERKTWPDRCLGVPNPAELCAPALTEGWQVVMSDGSSQWTYRTDSTGQTVRMARTANGETNLPSSVSEAVRKNLSIRLRVRPESLYIVSATQRQWPNGCLGINQPGVMCTQAIVDGWEVKVASRNSGQLNDKFWVYRTNFNGSVVVLDESASVIGDSGTVKSAMIPANELPPPLSQDMVFRAISSGGFAGRTYETILMRDGRLLQSFLVANGSTQRQVIRQLSVDELRQFMAVVEKQRLSRYNRMNFLPAPGSADYITVTLTSRDTTTRFADSIQGQLPQDLQAVVRAWNDVVNRR